MPVLECPHCHTTVFVSGEECPRCHKNVKDTKGATPKLTRREVLEGEPLPPLCIGCGAPTERVEELFFGTRGAELVKGALVDALKIAAVATHRGHFGNLGVMKRDDAATVGVHRCEGCAAAGPFSVEREDRAYDRRLLTVLVHVRWAEALDRLREKQS